MRLQLGIEITRGGVEVEMASAPCLQKSSRVLQGMKSAQGLKGRMMDEYSVSLAIRWHGTHTLNQ